MDKIKSYLAGPKKCKQGMIPLFVNYVICIQTTD